MRLSALEGHDEIQSMLTCTSSIDDLKALHYNDDKRRTRWTSPSTRRTSPTSPRPSRPPDSSLVRDRAWHTLANCFSELIIGMLLNRNWCQWQPTPDGMGKRVTPKEIADKAFSIFVTIVSIAKEAIAVMFMQTIFATISIMAFALNMDTYRFAYYATLTMLILARFISTLAKNIAMAAWSPITTAVLIACRIALLGNTARVARVAKSITSLLLVIPRIHDRFVIIPLRTAAQYTKKVYRTAPRYYQVSADCVLGNPNKGKRRSSFRARYFAVRIVVDDCSSAAEFAHVLFATLFKGMLLSALRVNCTLNHHAHQWFVTSSAQPFRYIESIAIAAIRRLHYNSSMKCISATARKLTRNLTSITSMLAVFMMMHVTSAGSSDDEKRGPPKFSGEKTAFVGWFMLMSAYVAWKLHSSASIFEELRHPPPAPPALDFGRVAPRPPNAPAPILNADGITIDNQADIVAAATAIAAWTATPIVAINADAVKEAQDAVASFIEDNVRLYGLIVQALPAWLVTSIYNSHRNDGQGAVQYLRTAYDARGGDSGDHAAQLAKLQMRYIDARNTLNADDVRKQFDAMMTAVAAIERTGNPRPNDATLIAMYENSLPPAYSQIRQLTRRAGHATFLNYHMDVMSQVSAELTASAPAISAFQGIGRRVNHPGGPSTPSPASGNPSNPCIQCGATGHIRPQCTAAPTKCTGCGTLNHLEAFCPKGSGTRRGELTPNGQRLIDRDIKTVGKKRPPHATSPSSYAAAAAGTQPAPPTPSVPPAPPSAALPPVAARADPAAVAQAHAAAVYAAQGHTDPLAAINAYASAMRVLGHGFCASAKPPPPPGRSTSHPNDTPETALVDTMATFWIVGSIELLWSISVASPDYAVETANGLVPVQAVGVALVWMLIGNVWECYEVPNVLVLPECPATLYSTRVMRELFGFNHDTDHNRIGVPGRADIAITNDGSSYSIPVVFVPRDTKRPKQVYCPSSPPAVAAMLSALSVFPAGVSGTTQATLHHRLGFPYADQWRHVPNSTTGHGLPPNARVSVDLPVREAILRGRARAAKWHSAISDHRTAPASGNVLYGFRRPSYAEHLQQVCLLQRRR